jgi:RNA polymerase sigma-70 factor (family 1)
MAAVSTLPDFELVSLLRQSNHAAYTEIYDRYKGLLLVHAYKYLHNYQEAEDTLHEIFTSLWTKRESFNITSNLSGYLYTAVRNRILDHFSHREVQSRYVSSFSEFLEKGEVVTDHKVRESLLRNLIEKEIDALPGKMREIFLLSRKTNLSHKEIAGQLDISEKTVKNQVNNALKILRAKLGLLMYLYMLFILLKK